MIGGDLGLGGRNFRLPRGSLDFSGPSELLVSHSAPCAFTPERRVAANTLRVILWGGTPIDQVPATMETVVVDCAEEEVIWGGPIAPPDLIPRPLSSFAHFLLESVARLWPLLPGGPLEGLPVVFTKPRKLPFVEEWLTAFGVNVVELPEHGTVRFKRMFVPEPAWQTGSWIAPEIRAIHLHARRRMAVPRTPGRDLLWLSRSKLPPKRLALDERLLEWVLSERIFAVHPETMTLAEQVAALEASRAVAV